MTERRTADFEYVVSAPMWPAGRSDDLTVGEVFAVLDKFDDAYPVAVAGLARTEVPSPTRDLRQEATT